MMAALLDRHGKAVADGRPTEPDLADGVRLQYVLEEVRESAREQAWRDLAGFTTSGRGER